MDHIQCSTIKLRQHFQRKHKLQRGRQTLPSKLSSTAWSKTWCIKSQEEKQIQLHWRMWHYPLWWLRCSHWAPPCSVHCLWTELRWRIWSHSVMTWNLVDGKLKFWKESHYRHHKGRRASCNISRQQISRLLCGRTEVSVYGSHSDQRVIRATVKPWKVSIVKARQLLSIRETGFDRSIFCSFTKWTTTWLSDLKTRLESSGRI